METKTLRDKIIGRIKHDGDFDYCFKRGDDNAKDFDNYEKWLYSLDDYDLIDAYARVKEAYCSHDD